MHLRFPISSIIAFIFLVFLLHEVHEMAHHLTGAMVCGGFGHRDFLYWKLKCDSRLALLIAGLAGPFITYFFMWLGFGLLRSRNSLEKKAWGFALVLGALPLPRILGAADRGGDEIGMMRMLINEKDTFKGAPVVVGGFIVLLCCLLPLWKTFVSIRNKNRLPIFLAFLILPWLTDRLMVTELLQGKLVPSGFLMNNFIAGIPLLVILWDLLLLAGFLLTNRYVRDICGKDVN
jgi:hypothetical protein